MTRATSSKRDVSRTSTPSTPSEHSKSKRQCVSSACVPCRKRKSKCDGEIPKCATCTAVYKTDCFYPADIEARRKSTLTPQKRDSTAVTETNEHAEFLLKSIRSLPESEVNELIQHLRRDSNADLSTLIESWKRVVTLPQRPAPDQSSLEGDLSVILGKPALTQSGVSRHYGHTSGLSLVKEDENYSRPPNLRTDRPSAGTWTNVTQDLAFIHHLMDLYFKWNHSFYILFSREAFYNDFENGGQKFCSPLLVNAICSFGCHYSDDPRARTNPDDPRTAGDKFFEEARQLLYEDESASLTTTQALCVMGMREPSAGRDSAGFAYMGRCMRMAVELGLHLDYPSSTATLGLTATEIEVRKITFWGLFVVDTAWSICIGRLPQLPTAAITQEKPKLDEPLISNHPSKTGACPKPISSRLFLEEFSKLSELINDNLFVFFAPRERFTSRSVLNTYRKYQDWYKALPPALRLPEDPNAAPHPMLLTLHMYFHTANLHLFRPLLKVDLLHSDVRPRVICVESANKISELLRLYRSHYRLRSCQLVISHIFLATCIVDLLFSPKSELHARNLSEGLEALEAMSTCHYFGARSFKIIYGLAKTWDLPFPEKILKTSKLIPRTEVQSISQPALPAYSTSPPLVQTEQMVNSYYTPSMDPTPQTDPLQQMYIPNQNDFTRASHASTSLNTTNPAYTGTQTLNMGSSYQQRPIHIPTPAPPPALIPSDPQNQLFWTPIPEIPVPLLSKNNAMGPMDLNNLLAGVDQWDLWQRDGFVKMSESWVPGVLGGGDFAEGWGGGV